MMTFKIGGMAVCTDAGTYDLVNGQAYLIEDYSPDDDCGKWLDLGPELGSFLARRFRPETAAEAICRARDTITAYSTALPDDNPKTRFGVAKPSVTLIPGPALIHCALAFRDGATKYGPANWRVDPVTASTYTDAAFRHLLDYWDGEDRASDSKVLHLAHAMACLAILIDAQEQGTLKDDRPTKGSTPRVIEENTRPLT
jgi:hypothetical protein